ncbi:MAG TPA: transglycosylase SLT domain-containing protein, partial [Thermoanaerobaculia bacterium]|nr:transglycosylase SLT domain-containing protein [Thermoanaerobaculia bacterium]
MAVHRLSTIWIAGLMVLAFGCGSPTGRMPHPVATPPPAPLPTTLEGARAELKAGHASRYEQALRRFTTSSDAALRLHADILLGQFLRDQKRYDEAIDSFRRAAVEAPQLNPFLLLKIVELQRTKGDIPAAIQAAVSLITTYPGSPASTDARLLLPALYADVKDAANVTRTAAELVAIPLDELTEQRFVETADAITKGAFPDVANGIRMRLLREYAQGRYTEKIYGQLAKSSLSPLDSMSYADLMKTAERLGRVNRYDQALDLLDRISRRFPEESTAAEYRFLKVTSLFNSRHYEDVVQIQPVEDEPYYVATQMLRARAYWRTSRSPEFLQIMTGLLRDYPESKEAAQVELQLAKYYMTDENDPAKSADYFQQALSGTGAGDNGENLWSLAWLYVSSGQDEKALTTMARYIESYPDADYTSNALFWSAKVYERMGRTAERDAQFKRLVTTYPYSYYSYRAYSHFNPRAREIAASPTPPNEIASGYVFPQLTITDPELNSRFEVVRQLESVELLPEATRELKGIVGSRPEDLAAAYALADYYSRTGESLKAIGILQSRFRNFVRHGGTGIPTRFWELLFPRPHWDIMQDAAMKAGIDVWYLPAIIRQESGFEPTIVSNAGAVGIMQIMPAEATRIATQAGLAAAVTRDDLFDVDRNIHVGAAEFAQKLAAVGGNPTYAIAAYNAGEDAVKRWLGTAPPADLDVFIESIPFNETRL